MNEIFTYPWVNSKYNDALCFDTRDMLSIISPPSADECYVRSSLLPNLCKAVSENLRNFSEFSIFESAQVFFNRNFESAYDSREVLPMQRKNIAGACVDEPKNLFNLFRRTKGILEAMPKYVHMEPLTFKKINRPDWADDVVWLNVFQEKETVGNFALLSKKSAITCGIKKSVVMLFELDIDLLKPYKSRTNEFKHLAEYPMVDYDLSLLFDLSVKWEDILDTLSQIDNQLIHKIRFVDEYTGEQIPEHKKSVTIRLLIGSFEKTLTSKEIKDCIDVVIDKLKISLGGELRD
jgi:phenylalanyl-tRNA synthetase beta chain